MSADANDPRGLLAPSAPWLVEAMGQSATLPVIPHHIGGQPATSGPRSSTVFNPATGAAIATATLADAAVVARAVAAAKAALPSWAETAPLKRARVMFRFKQLLDARFDELAALSTREHGKVLADAKGELMRGLEIVEFACLATRKSSTSRTGGGATLHPDNRNGSAQSSADSVGELSPHLQENAPARYSGWQAGGER
jgi:delta 1-pyrroline-5-carboxylate dehydrogenase